MKLQITTLDGERSILRDEISVLDTEKSKLMNAANDYTQAKATLDAEISSAMEQYEIDNTAISASNKRLEQINTRLPQIKIELEEIVNARADIDSQIQKIKDSIEITNGEKNKINRDLELIDSERNKILTEQSEAAAKKSEIDNKIKILTDQSNNVKLKLSKILHEKEESELKIKSNSEKLNELEKDIVELTNLESKLSSLTNNHQATISELKSRISKLKTKKLKIIHDMDELGFILEKSDKAANQYESKIKTVKGFMHEDYTVAKLKEDADKLGIDGLVYEMISWDKKYERSVLAVSSDWIKALVVKDFATLLGIAEVARSKKLPKLKIIPLDAIPKFKLSMPKESGIIGVLSDFVKCADTYSALKTFLFGNIILADSRESAYNLSQLGYKSVTLEGEFFEAKGGTVVIDINSKISKLTKLIYMSSDIDGLIQSISLIKKYMLKKKYSLKKLEDSIQSYSDRLSISENALTSASENYTNLKSRIISAKNTKVQLTKRISDLISRNNIISSEVSTNESHLESLLDRIGIVEQNYASGEQTRIASELSKINIKKSDIEKLYTSIMNDYRDKSSQLTTMQTQDNREKSQTTRLNDEENSLHLESEQIESKIDDLEKQKDPKREILEGLRQKEQELI